MLNDPQHEKLKKLLKIALDTSGLFDRHQRRDALEDMADIIDPEHWNRGLCMKPTNHHRESDERLHDAFQPTAQRTFPA